VKMMFADKEEHARLMAEFDAELMYRFVVKQDPFEGLCIRVCLKRRPLPDYRQCMGESRPRPFPPEENPMPTRCTHEYEPHPFPGPLGALADIG
jgi:hypothetical protein